MTYFQRVCTDPTGLNRDTEKMGILGVKKPTLGWDLLHSVSPKCQFLVPPGHQSLPVAAEGRSQKPPLHQGVPGQGREGKEMETITEIKKINGILPRPDGFFTF